MRVHSYRTKDAGNPDPKRPQPLVHTSEVAIYTSQPPMRLGAQTLTQISINYNSTLPNLPKHTLIH